MTLTFVPQVALASFACFVMISDDNILSARKAFVSLALFELMNVPLISLPSAIAEFVQVWCENTVELTHIVLDLFWGRERHTYIIHNFPKTEMV